ncbi:MAG TPA: hypothetical protein VMF52_03140 [Steroidobacteraceae bacterium]|nr:hypothetical protein [Steroidobacteraceae bacterium]
MIRLASIALLCAFQFLIAATPAAAAERWTAAKANAWYDKQPWLVGSNYNPATAINELEMWQAETFDPATIDRELGWAESIGMNTMRVFLHNLPWEQDGAGFKKRIDQFLEIAAKHRIKPLFVLFDSCWDPEPKSGPQHPPIPGVHNSGWVQAPGRARLEDESQYPKLRGYVEDIVGSFAKDERVLGWDVWNEPDNDGGGNYPKHKDKQKFVEKLLPQVFAWARSKSPTQPLTSGVWHNDDWSYEKLSAIEKIQMDESDVISFHDYGWPESFDRRAKMLQKYGRPLLCTEFMARGNGSTFDGSLPLGKKYNIAMMNWGFVDGRTQTRLPWDSWKKPYTSDEPTIWFHEVFRADGSPYRRAETDLIKRLSSAPKGVVPQP